MEQTRPPDPRTRPAPAQERARTAPAQPAPAKPAAQPAPPQVASTPAENLTISPVLSGAGGSSLAFDWEAVTMGSNRSYVCAVSATDEASISVTMTQGMYRRSYTGDGNVKTGPVPPASSGTEGSLAAQNVSTGESVTYVWRWQPKSAATPAGPPPSRGGLLAKLFSRGKTATAEASRAAVKKQLTVAERLGPRAAQAFTLRFFGQEAVGQRFAFILDKSGSMHGPRWRACREQLTRSLRVLPPHVEFLVVLFGSDIHEPPQQGGWLKASPGEIDAVVKWVSTQRAGGGNRERPAFDRVFSFSAPPDVIYFLTDGMLADFTPNKCDVVPESAPTIVNTIALENEEGREVLTAIAERTGGTFTLIPSAGESGTT
jgi:hypothetical protein